MGVFQYRKTSQSPLEDGKLHQSTHWLRISDISIHMNTSFPMCFQVRTCVSVQIVPIAAEKRPGGEYLEENFKAICCVEKGSLHRNMHTPGKINLEPEQGPLEDDFPLQPSGFQVLCKSFRA